MNGHKVTTDALIWCGCFAVDTLVVMTRTLLLLARLTWSILVVEYNSYRVVAARGRGASAGFRPLPGMFPLAYHSFQALDGNVASQLEREPNRADGGQVHFPMVDDF